jgi:hypothetical protein
MRRMRKYDRRKRNSLPSLRASALHVGDGCNCDYRRVAARNRQLRAYPTLVSLGGNVVIDAWYKGMLVAAFALLLASLTLEIRHVDQPSLQLISAGLVLVGFGEWANHPHRMILVPGSFTQPGYKVETTARQNTFWGCALDVAGLILVGSVIVKAVA